MPAETETDLPSSLTVLRLHRNPWTCDCDVTEGRRRNGAQPVRLEVEDLEVAQSSERVWGDSLDVIAAEVDVLQGLVGVERVDAEERQLVVREL